MVKITLYGTINNKILHVFKEKMSTLNVIEQTIKQILQHYMFFCRSSMTIHKTICFALNLISQTLATMVINLYNPD